jgi:hypothetical protein
MLQPFYDLVSGYYHLRGSDYFPSGTYWVDVLSKGREATLSFKQNGEEVGFVNAVNNKLWHGFYESVMIPCCDLRNLSLTPVVTELAA